MSKIKLSNIITKITIISASLGTFFAIYKKYKKINKEINEKEEYEDDFDFDKIDKSSRDYVSININERKGSSEHISKNE